MCELWQRTETGAYGMTDWLTEVVTELQYREEVYRQRDDESEYWDNVANGVSEALDVLDEADRKRSTENLETDE